MKNQPTTFSLSYQLTYPEYKQIFLRLFFFYPGSSWKKPRFGLSLYLAILAGVVTWLIQTVNNHLSVNFFPHQEPTLFCFYFLVATVVSYWKYSRKYQKPTKKRFYLSVDLKKKAITFFDKKKENLNTVPKKDVTKLIVESMFIYIIHENGLRYILPKRCFTDSQIQALTDTFNS
jgi:hypothetical protein